MSIDGFFPDKKKKINFKTVKKQKSKTTQNIKLSTICKKKKKNWLDLTKINWFICAEISLPENLISRWVFQILMGQWVSCVFFTMHDACTI